MSDFTKHLIPPEAQISQILAQTIKDNPSRYPAVVLEIEFARFIVKTIGKLEGEYNKSVKRLDNMIDNK